MKIAFITTVRHNVGDDFVREGIKYLFNRQFGNNGKLTFSEIHKHSPITSRFGFEWLRDPRVSLRVDRLLPLWLTRDRILEADLVVQSGAPAYWCHEGGPHCAENEWYGPLVRRRLMRAKHRPQFANIAAGTAQRYHSDGSEFAACSIDAEYIRELFAISNATTVRDQLSRRVLRSLGLDAPVIPCSSLFAVDRWNVGSEAPEYVALNFMPLGGHYSFNQGITPERWTNEFKAMYAQLSRAHTCAFVCHSAAEVVAARTIDPAAKVLFSTDYVQVMKFYAKAKFGVLNRIHGAFMLASLGRPSVVIGTDSRALMVDEIRLPHLFVEDASAERLHELIDSLRPRAYGELIKELKSKALNAYEAKLDGLG